MKELTVIIKICETTGEFLGIHTAFVTDYSGYEASKVAKEMNSKNDGIDYIIEKTEYQF